MDELQQLFKMIDDYNKQLKRERQQAIAKLRSE